jgi:hypothetical protein
VFTRQQGVTDECLPHNREGLGSVRNVEILARHQGGIWERSQDRIFRNLDILMRVRAGAVSEELSGVT